MTVFNYFIDQPLPRSSRLKGESTKIQKKSFAGENSVKTFVFWLYLCKDPQNTKVTKVFFATQLFVVCKVPSVELYNLSLIVNLVMYFRWAQKPSMRKLCLAEPLICTIKFWGLCILPSFASYHNRAKVVSRSKTE